MPTAANGYYLNPQVGQIASNLGTMIFGDPEAKVKGDYYRSEIDKNSQTALKTQAETQALLDKRAAGEQVGSSLSSLFIPDPGETPLEHFQKHVSDAAAIIRSAGGNTDQVAGGIRGLFSIAAGMGDVNDQGRSLVLQGKVPTQNFAPTVERADAVAARNSQLDTNKETTVQNVRNAGMMDRLYNTPINAGAGDTVYLSPNDPRRKSLGDQLYGAPTKSTVQGEAGQTILNTPVGQQPSTIATEVFNSGGKGSKAPKSVSPKDMNDIERMVAMNVPGAVHVGSDGKKSIDQRFFAQFDPSVLNVARTKAAQVYQQTRDASQATNAYMQALGITPGVSLKGNGFFSGGGAHLIDKSGNTFTPSAGGSSPDDLVKKYLGGGQ